MGGSRGSLAELLAGSADLTEQVLGHLPLAALAALQCTCKATCASVSQLPEACWQAAAVREYPAFHPLLSAPSKREYLRLQHAIRATIFDGMEPDRPKLHRQARGCLSPDFTKAAELGPQSKLRVLDAVSGAQLSRWQMPREAAAACPPSTWGWDPTGRHLVLLYGKAWTVTLPGEVPTEAPHLSGLIFVDTQTGECRTLQLGAVAAAAGPPVLVHEAVSERVASWQVHDCQGGLLCSHSSPELAYRSITWAPAGQAVALLDNDDQSLWLWDVGAVPPVMHELYLRDKLRYPVWGHPYCGRLLGLNVFYAPDPVCMIAMAGARELLSCQLRGAACGAAWGRQTVALLPSNCFAQGTGGVTALRLWLLAGDWLVLNRSLTEGSIIYHSKPQMQPSPGGELLALLVEFSDRPSRARHLAVVDMESGALRTFALSRVWQSEKNQQGIRLQWAPDSRAVLVASQSSDHREVVSSVAPS